MLISLLVAASTNNVIGKNNSLPWHLPEDLKFFKNITWGMPVIMGRKTFESVNKPLKGRFNIIVTRNPDWKVEGTIRANDIEDAVKKAAETNCREAFVIGGGEIFNQCMNIADKIYLTRVNAVLDGDVFLPEIDQKEWQLISTQDFKANEKHSYDFSFQLWKKYPVNNQP